jgi:LysM repeat protein
MPLPLTAYANARLLLFCQALPGRFDSERTGRVVVEAFLVRGRMVSANSTAPGTDTGDFTYEGSLTRAAVLPLMPPDPWDWLDAALPWSSEGVRPSPPDAPLVEAPATGLIWLGPLAALTTPPALPSTGRGQLAGLTVNEFGGPHGAGGIGALTQPLLGERLLLVLKPNRVIVLAESDTLAGIAARYGTTVATLRELNPDLSGTDTITTAEGDTLNGLAEAYGTTVTWLRDQPENAWILQTDGHTIVAGDTLTSVAAQYGTTRTTLRTLNPAYADHNEWPGDAPLPLGEVLQLFAIRPSFPLPAGETLLVPLYRPSTPLPAGGWLLIPRRRAASNRSDPTMDL